MKVAKINELARTLVRPQSHRSGLNVVWDGRRYPRFVPSPPKGMRWKEGHLISRHSDYSLYYLGCELTVRAVARSRDSD